MHCKPLSQILDEVVTAMRDKGTFNSIVKSLTGSIYTLTFAKAVKNTYIDDLIIITSVTNGTQTIKVKTITTDNKSVTFEYLGQLTNENGTFENKMPIFEYEFFDVEANFLNSKNVSNLKFEKYPLIFFLYDFDEKREEEFRFVNFKIYIIDKTEASTLIPIRDETTFIKLRNIYYLFLEKLKNSKYVTQITTHNYKELPYRDNKLNVVIDAIELTFNNLQLNYCN